MSLTHGSSLVDYLYERSGKYGDRSAYVFLDSTGQVTSELNYTQLLREAGKVANALKQITRPGDRVVLILPHEDSFIKAFYGCLLAKVIAVPVPTPGNIRKTGRLKNILNDSEPSVILTSGAFISKSKKWFDQRLDIQWLAMEELQGSGAVEHPDVNQSDIAFLQYTSGSTGNPKGVMVTHGNLVNNLGLIKEAYDLSESTPVLSWLPLFHDMGLIGNMLQGVYSGMPVYLLKPEDFIKRPLNWLKLISEKQIYFSGGPNFAFDLCVESVSEEELKNLDLSSWKVAFNGAEPVKAQSILRFNKKFQAAGLSGHTTTATYGMAETTLVVSGKLSANGPKYIDLDNDQLRQGVAQEVTKKTEGTTYVGNGYVLPGYTVRIVSPDSMCECEPNQIGEIWLSGPSVAIGYWNKKEITESTFKAYLHTNSGGEEGSFFRTGDMGFLLDGELFITGRLKEMMIVGGMNYYPQDIENTVQSTSEHLTVNAGAAFSIESDDSEKLVVFQEIKRTSLRHYEASVLFEGIRQAVFEEHNLSIQAIVLLSPGRIPKTSSGKIQRGVAKQSYLEGDIPGQLDSWHLEQSQSGSGQRLPEVQKTKGAQDLEDWLVETLSGLLEASGTPVNAQTPFAAAGLSSIQSIRFCGLISEKLGRDISPVLLYDYPTVSLLAAYLAGDVSLSRKKDRSSLSTGEDIAIISMSCRFPGADDPDTLFDNLIAGVDSISKVPATRWSGAEPNESLIRHGGFIEKIDKFDASLFHISEAEARQMDPQQRILLELCHELIERARYAPDSLKDSDTGVFIGAVQSEYGHLLSASGSDKDVYTVTANALSILANRLSYQFGFQGPSVVVDTACSSSLMAIHEAVKSLKSGECSLAIAGGVNLMLSPETALTLQGVGALSPDGRCKTFDASANGYVRSEGCGIVLLKPLSLALSDGDEVLGIIKGSAVNQDGASNGLTAPNGLAQQEVIESALTVAGVKPAEVGYVECHGTGTELGDPVEVSAIQAVYGKDRAGKALKLGSLKANIGHLEAAAGVAGFIKSVKMLQEARVPKQIHFNTPNPHIQWGGIPLSISTESEIWSDEERKIGLSSFGIGGTNVHMILGQAPTEIRSSSSDLKPGPRARQLVLISAESRPALSNQISNIQTHASHLSDADLPSLCYSLATTRTHYRHRLAMVTDSQQSLKKQLSEVLATGLSGRGKTAFLFTGGGAQYAGMGKKLYHTEPYFRLTMDRCLSLVKEQTGEDYSEIIFAEEGTENALKLNKIEHMLLGLFVIEYSLTRLWQHWGVQPDYLIGHSLGELVAATVAGVFSLKDGIRLVAERGRLMASVKAEGVMASVECDAASLSTYLKDEPAVSIAAENGPVQTVVSGAASSMSSLVLKLTEAGIKVKLLPISQASHSPMMDEILGEFRKVTSELTYHHPGYQLISNLTGELVGDEMCNPEYWVNHLRQPVRFSTGMKVLEKAGVTSFIEIGPSSVLLGMGSACLSPDYEGQWLPSLQKEEDDETTLLESLGHWFTAGNNPNWSNFYAGRKQKKVDLPSYAFHRKRYWIPTNPERANSISSHPLWKAIEEGDPEKLKTLIGGEVNSENLAAYAKSFDKSQILQKLVYSVEWNDKKINTKISTAALAKGWVFLWNNEDSVSAAFKASFKELIETCGGTVLETNKTEEVISLLKESEEPPKYVISFWPDTVTGSLADQAERNSLRGLKQLQALKPVLDDKRLIWLSEGVFKENAVPNLAASSLWGLGKVFINESRHANFRLIDLQAFNPEEVCMTLLELVASDKAERALRIETGQVSVQRLVRANISPQYLNKEDFQGGSVLITGGLGALGMITAEWLAEKQVSQLVLLGRRAAKAAVQERVAAIEQKGTKVLLLQCDVARIDDLRQVIETVQQSEHPLTGVIHAAGISKEYDQQEAYLLENHSEKDLLEVCEAKVRGTWNLHELTKDCDLQFFVSYSSISSVLGTSGLNSYVAANTFLDVFSAFRKSLGLPTTTVNWGLWSEGLAVSQLETIRQQGFIALDAQSAFEALSYQISSGIDQAVAHIDWSKLGTLYQASPLNPLLSLLEDIEQDDSTDLAESPFVVGLRLLPEGLQHDRLTAHIQEIVAAIFMTDPADVITHQGLAEQGLTSLQGVELANTLSQDLGFRISPGRIITIPTITDLSGWILSKLFGADELSDQVRVESNHAGEPIAIIGTGLRLPGGVEDLEGLWRLMDSEVSTESEVPSDRWSMDAYFDSDRESPGKTYTRKGSFIKGHDQFDREFFRISPEEASRMDPMHRLMLECGWHALEDSGIVKSELEETRTGIFVGIGHSGYSPATYDIYDTPGLSRSFSAGRLSYFLGLNGPSISVDTACSSSLSALHMAVQSLHSGDCDMALAAGVSLMLTPDHYIALSRMGALSPDGKCKAFSFDADGFGRGEGCVVLVLRPLSAAQERGDNILGVIRSTAMNHDGASSGLTVPNGKSHEKLMKEALAKAGLSADSVSYIEGHGTGTDLGDPIEVESIQRVFGRSERETPLRIGTIKSNIGHLEAASGVAGIAKVLVSFLHDRLPKSLHSEVLNPRIDWESYPVEVVQEATAWPRGIAPRIAGVSNFGLSGTNVHVLLEEAPVQTELTTGTAAPRSSQLAVVSAESRQALLAQVAALREHVSDLDDAAFQALCYSLATTRTHFRHRLALVADSHSVLLEQLSGSVIPGQTKRGKTAFLYTGGGSQYAGMGKELYDSEPFFRMVLNECFELIREKTGEDYQQIIFAEEGSEGAKKLDGIEHMLVSLFAIEYSLTKLWENWGVQPGVLIGHSLGEIVAATIAGIFSLEDGIALVAARGKLMASVKEAGSMASVECDMKSLQPYVEAEADVDIAAENGPFQTVISGALEPMERVIANLTRAEIKVKVLPISQASHSPMMDVILEDFHKVARQLTYHEPKYPLISNLTGQLAGNEMCNPDYWVKHLRQTVRFSTGMQTLQREGVTSLIEMGPQAVLLGMGSACVSDDFEGRWLASLQKEEADEPTLLKSLAGWYEAGNDPDWSAFYKDREQKKLPLPPYAFQSKRYWLEEEEQGLIQSDDPLWQALEAEDQESINALLGSDFTPQNLIRYLKRDELAKQAAELMYVTKWDDVLEPLLSEGPMGDWVLLENGFGPITDEFKQSVGEFINELGGQLTCTDNLDTTIELMKKKDAPGLISCWTLANETVSAERAEELSFKALTQLKRFSKMEGLKMLWITQGAFEPSCEAAMALQSVWSWGKAAIIEGHEPDLRLIDVPAFNREMPGAALTSALRLNGPERLFKIEGDRLLTQKLVRYQSTTVGTEVLADLSNASVLITGGLGYIGLKTAHWLSKLKVGQLILIGRSRLSEQASEEISIIERGGSRVSTYQCDVSDLANLKMVLDQIDPQFPLKGVVHAATVLSDGLLVNQSQADINKVYQAKVKGAVNLHECTKGLDLDFFILYSSVSAILTPPSLGNYAGANAFLDALATFRQSQGLAATSVNWGLWDGGVADDDVSQRAKKHGMKVLNSGAAFHALESILKSKLAKAAILDMDWSVNSHYYGNSTLRSLISTLIRQADNAPTYGAFLESLHQLSEKGRRQKLADHLQGLVAEIINKEKSEVDVTSGLFEMGMTSLQSVELANTLSRDLGIRVSPGRIITVPTIHYLTEWVLSKIFEKQEKQPETVQTSGQYAGEPIAIVGTGLRLPGGVEDLEGLWQLMDSEISTVSEIPSDRWQADRYFDADRDRPGKYYTRYGSFVDNYAGFDREFFRISPEEATKMDPMHRMLLESSWHALEGSRTAKSSLEESRTGIFVGIGSSGYGGEMSKTSLGGYDATGQSISFSAGRLSYFLGLNGPSIAVDTACSSSLSAVHMAVQSLQNGDCEMALAGGVNLILNPDHYIALSRTGALSPDGKCKAFSSSADGFGRGEGCVMLALRPLSVAEERGDEILGVIRATAMNHDGASSGLTVPNGKSQEKLLREALSKAGIPAGSVSYIEAHGTGTDLGDPIEVESLQQVFGQEERKQPLHIGTIKSNISHLEAASGVAGILKILASFRHNRLPKSLHSEELNPKIDWASFPVEVVRESMTWSREEEPRIAGVSNFGLSGTNVHVLLEEAPEPARVSSEAGLARPYELAVVSAESREALAAQISTLKEKLTSLHETELQSLCYSLAATRTTFRHRMAFVTDSKASLLEQLSSATIPAPVKGGKTAFLYTGQGAQYVGMGQQLYEHEPVFRHWMDQCLSILSAELDEPFEAILFGNEDQLNQTQYTQPGLFALEFSLTKLWQHWGVEPDYLMGHSLGEIVAATVAGIFSLEDGIRLVVARGRLMGSLPVGGAMISVSLSRTEVAEYLDGHQTELSLAGENSPDQVVLSGYSEAIETIKVALESDGHKVKTLNTSHAFHSPQMDAILDPFEKIASDLTYHAPEYDLVSNATGALGAEEMQTAAYWVNHIREAVLFAKGVQSLEELGVARYVEMGPAPVLSHLGMQSVEENSKSTWYHSLSKDKDDVQEILKNLAGWYSHGGDVIWQNFYEGREQPCINLPNYRFQRETYRIKRTESPLRIGENPLIQAIQHKDEHQIQTLLGGDFTLEKMAEYLQGATDMENNLVYKLKWEAKSLSLNKPEFKGKWLLLNSQTARSTAIHKELMKLLNTAEAALTEISDVESIKSIYKPDEISGIISLWPAAGTDTLSGTIEHTTLEGLYQLQKLMEFDIPLYWFTEGVCSETPKEDSLAFAPLWGLGRVYLNEFPQNMLRMIDLESFEKSPHQRQLTHVFANESDEHFYRFSGDQWQVPRLVSQVNSKRVEPVFDQLREGTVLITGGLGALGLESAEWLASKKVGQLLLLSRRTPTDEINERLKAIEAKGVKLIVASCDVANRQMLSEILVKLDPSYPLCGVLHTAGVLDDAIFVNQNKEKIQNAFKAKVEGTINLHELTRDRDLGFFILYSSFSSVLGSPGQANYAAANAFMDRFAAFRRQQGLTAVSVNWGVWNMGMATDAVRNESEAMGMLSLDTEQAFRALESQISGDEPNVSIVNIDWQRFLANEIPDIKVFSQFMKDDLEADSLLEEPPLLTRLKSLSSQNRYTALIEHVKATAGSVLTLEADTIDITKGLTGQGMTSLQGVEISGTLSQDLGVRISPAKVVSLPSIDSLVEYILELVFPTVDASEVVKDELDKLIKGLSTTLNKELSDNTSHQLTSGLFKLLQSHMLEDNEEIQDLDETALEEADYDDLKSQLEKELGKNG